MRLRLASSSLLRAVTSSLLIFRLRLRHADRAALNSEVLLAMPYSVGGCSRSYRGCSQDQPHWLAYLGIPVSKDAFPYDIAAASRLNGSWFYNKVFEGNSSDNTLEHCQAWCLSSCLPDSVQYRLFRLLQCFSS